MLDFSLFLRPFGAPVEEISLGVLSGEREGVRERRGRGKTEGRFLEALGL